MSGRIDAMGRLMESVPGRVIRKFLEDQAPNWAALIAWNALFAMFPIVIFAASLLGLVLRLFGQANDTIYSTIFTSIPGDPRPLLDAFFVFFFSSRRRHTRSLRDWSSDVCSSD